MRPSFMQSRSSLLLRERSARSGAAAVVEGFEGGGGGGGRWGGAADEGRGGGGGDGGGGDGDGGGEEDLGYTSACVSGMSGRSSSPSEELRTAPAFFFSLFLLLFLTLASLRATNDPSSESDESKYIDRGGERESSDKREPAGGGRWERKEKRGRKEEVCGGS